MRCHQPEQQAENRHEDQGQSGLNDDSPPRVAALFSRGCLCKTCFVGHRSTRGVVGCSQRASCPVQQDRACRSGSRHIGTAVAECRAGSRIKTCRSLYSLRSRRCSAHFGCTGPTADLRDDEVHEHDLKCGNNRDGYQRAQESADCSAGEQRNDDQEWRYLSLCAHDKWH